MKTKPDIRKLKSAFNADGYSYFFQKGRTVSISPDGIIAVHENHNIVPTSVHLVEQASVIDPDGEEIVSPERSRKAPPSAKKVDAYDELERQIKAFLRSPPHYSLMVIAGKPGTGKSTALKAVAETVGGLDNTLPGAKMISKHDKKIFDTEYASYMNMSKQEKESFVLKKLEDAKDERSLIEYSKMRNKYRETRDPYYKSRMAEIIEKYTPKSTRQRISMVGAQEPPYKGRVYAGSQNANKGQLYFELYRSNGNVIVYDDSNISFWEDKNLQDLILHASQTEKTKWVSMPGEHEGYIITGNGNVIPDKFLYSGKIIIITNRQIKELPQNIQSRISVPVNFNPSSSDVLKKTGEPESLKMIKRKYEGYYSSEDVESVYEWLKENVGKGIKYDFRLFDKLLLWKSMYPEEEEFGKQARKMIRDFYLRERDETKMMRERTVRSILQAYSNDVPSALNQGQRKRIREFLMRVPDNQLNDPDLFTKLDRIAGVMRQG